MKDGKLEIEDLMIGDWVYIPNSHTQWGKYDYADFDLYNPKPIPLTPEILKKNGFEEKFTHNCYVNGKTISVDVPESLKSQSCILWIGGCFCDTILHIQISYVHELQRALRCCGLWDLAENFKI